MGLECVGGGYKALCGFSGRFSCWSLDEGNTTFPATWPQDSSFSERRGIFPLLFNDTYMGNYE